jgi:hypothetical protein
VNIIRDRADVDKTVDELKSLGADYVYTEKEFRTKMRTVISVRLCVHR